MIDNSEDFTEVFTGMPTLALLPAKQFKFNVSKKTFTLKVPNSGRFVDIDAEFFKEDSGSFEIYSEGNVNISILTKVLFATKQYPDLKGNQIFCPINFKLDGKDILVYGQVVSMVGVSDE